MKKTRNFLPKNAKMVFSGKSYETWQWEQEMYDGKIKIFEKIKRSDEVGVITVVEGKILIQDQKQPHRDSFISLPGGGCDKNETPLQAAQRELLEETGYISKNISLWKIIPSPYSSIIREAHYFIAKDCFKIQDLNLDNGEKIKNRFVSFEEFLMLSENDNFRNTDIINDLLKIRLNINLFDQLKEKLFS